MLTAVYLTFFGSGPGLLQPLSPKCTSVSFINLFGDVRVLATFDRPMDQTSLPIDLANFRFTIDGVDNPPTDAPNWESATVLRFFYDNEISIGEEGCLSLLYPDAGLKDTDGNISTNWGPICATAPALG